MKKLIVMAVTLLMTACSTTGDYTAYVAAQQEANRLAMDGQKPLVRLTAQPGMAITGLSSLEVFTPQAAPTIQQARPNEWAGVMSQAIGVVGTVGGIVAAGHAAVGLADSVGKAGTAGYQYIQAPGANTTIGANSGANSGNSGRIAGTTMADATSTPTVVNAPDPVIVTQPEPVIVTQPSPLIVQPVQP